MVMMVMGIVMVPSPPSLSFSLSQGGNLLAAHVCIERSTTPPRTGWGDVGVQRRKYPRHKIEEVRWKDLLVKERRRGGKRHDALSLIFASL